MRTMPIVLSLVPIGHSLMRGQVEPLLLLLLAGMVAALLRGDRFRAGLWVAGAASVKIIPAVLLAAPIWRRDVRCLLGACIGLVAGLLLVPWSVIGVDRTLETYRSLYGRVLVPGLVGRPVEGVQPDGLTLPDRTNGFTPYLLVRGLACAGTQSCPDEVEAWPGSLTGSSLWSCCRSR